ncbi:1-(5-phosphoribosyl)-5-[(5-phosphoribosylamino)methylideneamino]imidazole-4-carboxamide isomerase [Marinigracilibium pacificum]|uniref:1-(5-phosphoribosyl)-5-[(5-phosphoribosylamino)methylideneamino] imidazole-4-carboxamide isomerase n=1 Tax=Marinigracilibium pacificum TaxID=2729599 RepID=A0A848ITY7_9BACT|nr:1-(5-phosphoribosyl)-5-[(5-phosphoribosylamino)methylideneamino] imidazole-4-carboxamide isomerase [Marinigracilibium pacificum]NMM46765.1 1-(5-phosphoribosyl)-5-[(5-phosphoribosylamino)methylideneamino] imidazole-4-carboxamide isomerase [Marinigracilibium pacificum]
MIKIIPSISVINGKTIRLQQGNFDKKREYEASPLDVAKQFQDAGLDTIHLVDLDGAQKGTPVNYNTLELISSYTDLKVNFSGGLHTDGDVTKAFEYGAVSVTAATIAVLNPDLFAQWIISYGREKVILGADALKGKIAIRGWQTNTQTDLIEHIDFFYRHSLKYVKTTDIAKDGILEGPSINLYEKILEQFPDLKLYASGGVRSVDDIQKLEEIGVYGVFFGKAFYEDRLKLKDLERFITRKV